MIVDTIFVEAVRETDEILYYVRAFGRDAHYRNCVEINTLLDGTEDPNEAFDFAERICEKYPPIYTPAMEYPIYEAENI